MVIPRSEDDEAPPSGTTLRVEGAVPGVPDRIGRYRVEGKLGGGGMGRVYLAHDPVMDRRVALKVLAPGRLGEGSAVARFRREIRIISRLNHPQIVAAFDADSEGSVHFLVMEYVPGTDLARLVERGGPLSVGTAADYIHQAATGLEHARRARLVHRDIKPSNLLLGPGGRVKIADLGLARAAESEESPGSHETQDGSTLGTPDYMAPEQADDPRRADIRADIYGLGCTLYHLLSGQVPFPVPGNTAKRLAHHAAEPTPLEELRPEVPTGLADVVRKMMEKDPARRFQTPAEVALALQPFALADIDGPSALASTLSMGPGPGPDPGAGLPPTEHMSEETGATIQVDSIPPAKSPTRVGESKGEALRVLAALAPWAVALLLAACVYALIRGGPPGVPPQSLTSAGGARPGVAAEPEPFTNSIGMELVPIPAGEFEMGSPVGEAVRNPDEGPLHHVRLTRPFFLGRYEVTQEQYERIMGRNPSWFSAKGGGKAFVGEGETLNLPVDSATWEEAVEFCRKLNEREKERRTGRHYRLPTEAEWEYACRAGSRAPFATGGCLSPDAANFSYPKPYCPGTPPRGPLQCPTPVGTFAANAFGLHDMHGNVAEWCADAFLDCARIDGALCGAYPNDTLTNPLVQALDGPRRVCRGGSFSVPAAQCRSAARLFLNQDTRNYTYGLRVACDQPE